MPDRIDPMEQPQEVAEVVSRYLNDTTKGTDSPLIEYDGEDTGELPLDEGNEFA